MHALHVPLDFASLADRQHMNVAYPCAPDGVYLLNPNVRWYRQQSTWVVLLVPVGDLEQRVSVASALAQHWLTLR